MFRELWILLVWLAAMPSAWAGISVSGQRGTEAYQSFVSEHGQELLDEVVSTLGVDGQITLSVHVSRDAQAMRKRALREQGGVPPDWADGLAYSKSNSIYMHASAPIESFRSTLVHEFAHIVFGALDVHKRAPRWFNEGTAIWLSETSRMERTWTLTRAALGNTLLSLRDISSYFPSGGARAEIAYAQAVHFVDFLNEQYGKAKFQRLLARFEANDTPFEKHVSAVYGLSLSAIEAKWRADMKRGWALLALFADSNLLFVLCSVLLLLGWWRHRLERRRRLRALHEQESFEDAVRAHATLPAADGDALHGGTPPTYH